MSDNKRKTKIKKQIEAVESALTVIGRYADVQIDEKYVNEKLDRLRKELASL